MKKTATYNPNGRITDAERIIAALIPVGRKNAVTEKELHNVLQSQGMHITTHDLREYLTRIRLKGIVKRMVFSSHGCYVEMNDGALRDYIHEMRRISKKYADLGDALEGQMMKIETL